MKKLLLSTLYFFLVCMQIQAQTGNRLRIADDFSNAALWTATNNGSNGTISVNAGTTLTFNSGCWSGNEQFCSKNVPNFTGGNGITPTQVPNASWQIEFSYRPTIYGSFGTSHLLMAMTDNGSVHPVQIGTGGSNFMTTNSDVIGVALCSPAWQGANSQVGIWVKDGNQGGNNVVYASTGSTPAGNTAIPNTFTTVSSPVAFSGAANVPCITNGIDVPVSSPYTIRLIRSVKNITLTVYDGSNSLLGTVIMVLPAVANPIVSPATGARLTAANFPQGNTSRFLAARIAGLSLEWAVNNVLSVTSNPGGPTFGLVQSNGPVYAYCNSAFNIPGNQVTTTVPAFGGTTNYVWNIINNCQGVNTNSQYTTINPTSVGFQGPLSSALACINNINGPVWDYPLNLLIVNIPNNNTAGNLFRLSQSSTLRVSPNCRLAQSNEEYLVNTTSLKLSPNPATDFLAIEVPTDKNITTLKVCNLNGQTVLERGVDADKFNLDISTLPSAVYILKLEGTGEPQVQKFIKN